MVAAGGKGTLNEPRKTSPLILHSSARVTRPDRPFAMAADTLQLRVPGAMSRAFCAFDEHC
jgi:hypothetical protein